MSLPATTWIRTNYWVEGRPEREAEPSSNAVVQSITPGYFRMLGIPLKRGRDLTAHDNTPGAPPVMLINETLARLLWPEYPGWGKPHWTARRRRIRQSRRLDGVVGIVADIHEGGLANNAVPEFYLPCNVHPPQTAYLVLHTAGGLLHFAGAIRKTVLAVDRDQPLSDVKPMEAVLTANFGPRRLAMLLLGSFAGIALLLAIIGMYGVIAYSVARRTQEVGIRRALGAQQADISGSSCARGSRSPLLVWQSVSAERSRSRE